MNVNIKLKIDLCTLKKSSEMYPILLKYLKILNYVFSTAYFGDFTYIASDASSPS